MRKKKHSFLKFKDQLNEQLKKRNLSIVDAANIAQTSKSVLHGWTTGSNPHDLNAVARLAQAFDITLYELLFGESDPCENNRDLTGYVRTEIFSGICEVSIKKLEKADS